MDTLFSSGQAVVWSVAEGAHGVLYVATGHRGRVYQVDPSGKSSLLWTAEQPEVFAIATDSNGVLYAGTSPDGKVYRIENGKATEYFAPKARYIWSLAAGPAGALYVGTGDQGKIYRVASAGKGELYYDTGQSHVTGLAVDSQGRLLAGTEPNGILYRVSAKDKAFVLYDASLPEIRAIIPQPDGTVYVAALGGSLAKRAQAATQASQVRRGCASPCRPRRLDHRRSAEHRARRRNQTAVRPLQADPTGRHAPGDHAVHARPGSCRRGAVGGLPDQPR